MWGVDLSKVVKRLHKLPIHIRKNLFIWRAQLLKDGLPATRRIPGYHDEPLFGTRLGQRSIKLNHAWRVIYEEKKNGQITIIEVQEINKHEY